jgi:hypothetical protein
MPRTEFISGLLQKFERRLEDCLGCCTCLTGVVAALEITVAEAKRMGAGLVEGDCGERAAAARAFAVRGCMQIVMPWEKIHV